jgi:two-component system chemotaxis response regulator CheB
MPAHDIITIGASAGGVEALQNLVRLLPPGLAASVFIVLHIPENSPSFLPVILDRAGKLPAIAPADKTTIKHRCIYVAPRDHHMLLEPSRVRIIHGPKENRHRPAVDPLFRSAASVYRSRVVGVVLTGNLDDGTAGLSAIKTCGGTTIVQDPAEALFPDMPANALRNATVDYQLSINQIAEVLTDLASHPPGVERSRPCLCEYPN